MRRTSIAAFVLLVSCGGLFAAPSSGDGGAPIDLRGKVSSLLAEFPAESPAKKASLCSEVLRLGPEAVAEVCARVVPPGQGDDARARFAVNGLAVHVTRPGVDAERERLLLTGVLLDSLAKAKDPNVAAFFLSQIQLAGKQEAIRPLEKYLVSEDLAGPAAAALLAIGGPDATRALRMALDQAPRSARLTLVQSLGAARSGEAVTKILPLAESDDPGIREAALFALANIGDPAAGRVLSRPLLAAPYRERSQAPALLLLYARRLVESGRRAEGVAAARTVLENYGRPEESQHASAALALVVSTLGERALPELLAAVDSLDRRFRGTALLLAEKIPGPEATRRFVEKAGASAADLRADIVAMLGQRGDPAALPFVRECLQNAEKGVRLAAIRALRRLGGDAVLPDLLALLASADADESAALKTALLGYPGSLVVPEAARLVEATPPPGKVVLIDVLGDKSAQAEIERVYRLTEDRDSAVREAALRALGKLAGQGDVARLVAMLETASASDAIVRLREAIAATVLRDPDSEKRADGLLGLLKDAGPARKTAILKLLPRIGGSGPLHATVEETASEDAAVQSAAVGALSRWPDEQAADELLRIVSTTHDRQHFHTAIQGYVRLVGRSRTPAPEKLAAYEKLLALSGENDDKKRVFAAMAAVSEPETLRLLTRYRDQAALRDAATAALLDLASAPAPWLAGHEAYSVLRQVEASLSDPAASARAGTIILERLREGGYLPLFDGRSLEGWKGRLANSLEGAQVKPEQRAAAQATADEAMRAHWKAVDGLLVFDGKGGSLSTTEDYADFELLADWRIESGGDGGLSLRGSTQVQFGDAQPGGSGGLYSPPKGPTRPSEKADRTVGEWNSLRVIVMGERVTVYLNDKRVVNQAVLEKSGERGEGTGPIGLFAHGTPLSFRNLFIRRIPADTPVAGMTADELSEGFQPLFNGRDLENWTGNTSGYVAEGGRIAVHPELGGGNLYTKKEYADFVVRFDFKLTPAANNGLGIRAPLEGDAAYEGMEIQILEDGSPEYWGLQPYQYHGSIYGVVPARRGVLRPVGEWNSEEVTVKGRRVAVVVNGTMVVDADLDKASAGGTMDHKDHPGLNRSSGHIGFLGHGSMLELQNIRIKEIR